MAVDEDRWIELWVDSGSPRFYVLKLVARADGKFEVTDPQKSDKTVDVFDTYEDADIFMTDEEYRLVDGRMSLDPDVDDEVVRAEKPR